MLIRRIGGRRLYKNHLVRPTTTFLTKQLLSSNSSSSSLPTLQYSSFYSTASAAAKNNNNNNNSNNTAITASSKQFKAKETKTSKHSNLPKFLSPLKLTTLAAINEHYLPQLHEPVHPTIERAPRTVFLEYLRNTENPGLMYENIFSKKMILSRSDMEAKMIYM